VTKSHIYGKIHQPIHFQVMSGLLDSQMFVLIQGQLRKFSREYESQI